MKYTGGTIPCDSSAGFYLRTYTEADREALKDALVPLTIERYTDQQLEDVILKHPGVSFEGVFVACDSDRIIGTATGVKHVEGCTIPADEGGTLHMVSALASEKGRGVGRAICASVINYLITSGCSYVDLTTDDFRKSAIVTYTRLGFRPVIDDKEMLERWTKLADELSLPVLISEAYK